MLYLVTLINVALKPGSLLLKRNAQFVQNTTFELYEKIMRNTNEHTCDYLRNVTLLIFLHRICKALFINTRAEVYVQCYSSLNLEKLEYKLEFYLMGSICYSRILYFSVM